MTRSKAGKHGHAKVLLKVCAAPPCHVVPRSAGQSHTLLCRCAGVPVCRCAEAVLSAVAGKWLIVVCAHTFRMLETEYPCAARNHP